MHGPNEKDAMTSCCLDRKEAQCATWRVHNGTDQLVRALCTHTRRLFQSFGGPVCADRISNCPLDRCINAIIYQMLVAVHKETWDHDVSSNILQIYNPYFTVTHLQSSLNIKQINYQMPVVVHKEI